jgi:hypothetical protein
VTWCRVSSPSATSAWSSSTAACRPGRPSCDAPQAGAGPMLFVQQQRASLGGRRLDSTPPGAPGSTTDRSTCPGMRSNSSADPSTQPTTRPPPATRQPPAPSLTYSALTGSSRHRDAAEEALNALAPFLRRYPRFAGWAAAVGEAMVAGPLQVAVVDRPDLLPTARCTTSPGAVVVASGPLAGGRPAGAAYVCRGFICEALAVSSSTGPGMTARGSGLRRRRHSARARV